MNKSKIILASLGGVTGLVSLVLAYLVWDAATVKEERVADLDGLVSSGDRLARLPVYPGPAAVKAFGENAAAFAGWRADAARLASSGDMTFEATTPPAFKTFLVAEAQRLSALPGAVDGRIVKPGFPFGFKDYITGGVLPASADLPRLQREWHDVATVIEILAKSGVLEITDVAMTAPPPAQEVKEEPRRNRRQNARDRRVRKSEEPKTPPPALSTFAIEFLARPAALVNTVNAFVSAPRFIVVDDFSFTRESDDVAEAIGADKKEERAIGRRGRRAVLGQEADEKQETARKKGIVTDPLTAPPLKVRMTVSVYDFRSLDATADADRKPEEKK